MDTNTPTGKEAWKIRDFIQFIILTIIIVLPIRLFVAQPFVVNGSSMVPTFETSQYLIVDQLSYHLHEPRRGDVIVFKYPKDETKFFIKRIIGLPNETIEIRGAEVIITNTDNPTGFTLEQPYVEFQKDTFMTTTLAADEYFVMGDNRAASLDSRVWGPLKKDLITGRAFVRLWPPSAISYAPGAFTY